MFRGSRGASSLLLTCFSWKLFPLNTCDTALDTFDTVLDTRDTALDIYMRESSVEQNMRSDLFLLIIMERRHHQTTLRNFLSKYFTSSKTSNIMKNQTFVSTKWKKINQNCFLNYCKICVCRPMFTTTLDLLLKSCQNPTTWILQLSSNKVTKPRRRL